VFDKILIANRGAIACRIARTLRRMGIGSVAVFSDADAGSLHVCAADEAIWIGATPANSSYLNVEAILAAARASRAEAIHPGYGFLSESAAFAARCEAEGLVFIGPTAENIRAFGLKHAARELARAHDVPLLPGTALLTDLPAALRAAERVGFPVMLKATAGGGGIGMQLCESAAELAEAFGAVGRLAASHLAEGGVLLERYVRGARHIEAQIFGDGTGRVAALGERDCSLQRRNQKVIEETPAPHLPSATRARLIECAVRLAAAVRYRSAGTVEFLYDSQHDEFYFLEVNTRLQVEHGVTEEVAGIDLVEWMIRCAAGDCTFLDPWLAPGAWLQRSRGTSIQARVYAEDAAADFRPASGTLTQVSFPADVRLETWVTNGCEVTSAYDPLLAKLIVSAPDRATAVRHLEQAIEQTRLAGIETNVDWLRQIVRSRPFRAGRISTGTLGAIGHAPRAIRVLSGGLATSIQDYPGRLGCWSVGVPPSGPMDSLAFRLGNRLLGNPEGAAGLEWTAVGPVLRFGCAARICLTGAESDAALDGTPLELYTPTAVAAGQTLRVGRLTGAGLRGYVLFRGGLDVPTYLQSRATFTLGGFGGIAGRNLAAGDMLRVFDRRFAKSDRLRADIARPRIGKDWTVRVLYGPHGAPDFFTEADIDAILAAPWKVHYNSNRTGVRLVGPRPRWARRDGGEAGLHPSNIHDNPYAVGAVDFTGDMPIVLGPDGPSLGGFVCPFVTIGADLWKLGQLAPGNIVHFDCVDETTAAAAAHEQSELLAGLGHAAAGAPAVASPASPGAPAQSTRASSPTFAGTGRAALTSILAHLPAQGPRPQVVYRRQGDRNLLIEYGPLALDLELRLRVHALMLELERLALPGIIDITPGIRSLQVHHDSNLLPQGRLLEALIAAEDRLGTLDEFEISSRVVHLPLSFRDPAVEETLRRYMASVRADAPWCPDNIEFIRRVNGLESAEEVRRIVFEASYLVMGLGDVYLGAPVAVPLDPRHRLVTTKYNPARTWTPPNVVGIGGAYLCIYGLEGPGGYQLFGRTIQVWNSHRRTREFRDGNPWLLRFFDQVRFFPVSHAELADWRRDFPAGRRELRIETDVFRLAEYRRFLIEQRSSIESFQRRRQAAFEAECTEWERLDEIARAEGVTSTTLVQAPVAVPNGTEIIEAPLSGNVWRIYVSAGDRIEKGTVIAAIEAMKTECSVPSPSAGLVRAVYITERQAVAPGMPMFALETAAPARAGGS
jgi:urea carboxylase